MKIQKLSQYEGTFNEKLASRIFISMYDPVDNLTNWIRTEILKLTILVFVTVNAVSEDNI